jgi:hypothetical protein
MRCGNSRVSVEVLVASLGASVVTIKIQILRQKLGRERTVLLRSENEKARTPLNERTLDGVPGGNAEMIRALVSLCGNTTCKA